MPELPEVAKITLGLRKEILGKDLINIKIHSGRYFRHGPPEGFENFLSGLPMRISEVMFRGKFIFITTRNDQGEWFIFNTLGMSGSWKKNISNHSHIEFIFPSSSVFFTDIRNFGTLKFINSRKIFDKKISSIGPDHLNFEISDRDFSSRLKLKKNDSLAEVLMNQKLIGGIGNYIKAEALYRAKLSPHRKVHTLTDAEFSILNKSICQVIKESFASDGASFSTYSGIENEKGNFVFSFQVYGRKKCLKGYEVTKETTLDGRTTHWVPEIQK